MENRRSRRKAERENRKANGQQDVRKSEDIDHHPITKLNPTFRGLSPKNDEQRKALSLLSSFDMVTLLGRPGTGKTFLASVWAAQQISNGDFKQLILVRPNCELGRPIGFEPGTLVDKMKNWLAPILDALYEVFTEKYVDSMIALGVIKCVPVAYLRGRSWKDSIILVDEAENLDSTEMECLVQRPGYGSRMVLMGDLNQCDLKVKSGLADIVEIDKIFERKPFVTLELQECVRGRFAAFMGTAYDQLKGRT